MLTELESLELYMYNLKINKIWLISSYYNNFALHLILYYLNYLLHRFDFSYDVTSLSSIISLFQNTGIESINCIQEK